jgi:probable rRNA maturation factor
MSKVFFYSADKAADIKNRNLIKELIKFLFENEGIQLRRVNYIFCSDKYLLKMNKEFLDHDTLTDVITFSLLKKNEPVYGEVYLSAERIKENAKRFATQYQNELLRVIIHGALHLCGYLDKSKILKEQMRNKEDFYLQQFKVSREANF